MPRTMTSTHRMGARVRIGKVNKDIDYTPFAFQEVGLIERVASPEEQKKGIIGYTARATVTFRSLREKNTKMIDSKIKELGKKAERATPSVAQVFKEGQHVLSDFLHKQRKVEKLQEVIPFNVINEHVGSFVNFKVDVVNSFENKISNVINAIERSKQRQQGLRDRERAAEGRSAIEYQYDFEVERLTEDCFKKELATLNEYKKKNLNEIKFGEEVNYFPLEAVREYTEIVVYHNYWEREHARLLYRRAKRLGEYEYAQQTKAILKDYPGAYVKPDGGIYYDDLIRQQTIILRSPGV